VYSIKGNGVFYLHRTLTLPNARRAQVRLSADELSKIWINGVLAAERAKPEGPGDGQLQATADFKAGENSILLKVVNYECKLCFFTFDLEWLDSEGLPPDVATILAATSQPAERRASRVRDYFRRTHSPEFRNLFEQLEAARDEREEIDRTIATTLVAKELENPRETFILKRGEYDMKGDKVARGTPAILPPLPEGAPTNRLGLAEWLVSRDNPLTARVIVNRFWQQYFGFGLVKTAEDLGAQGERPSHPELLDWLASEFMLSGWDVKHLQRLIVLSATYRQSSQASAEQRKLDPENRLLARGPRFRVDAEVVRDEALFVSGLLEDQIGGPSAKPFQPAGLWEAVSHENRLHYVPDEGAGRYRRSVYTFWRRQSPPPNMLIFDAPTREACVLRRARTSTPLQALVLLNDPQFVEAARAFARKTLRQGGQDDPARIAFAFREATARAPNPAEVGLLQDLLNKQLAKYRQGPELAEKLAGSRPALAGAPDDRPALAAWTIVASVILNLDETVTKN
jgi:hypothetical protein